jgi:hypothetical protein
VNKIGFILISDIKYGLLLFTCLLTIPNIFARGKGNYHYNYTYKHNFSFTIGTPFIGGIIRSNALNQYLDSSNVAHGKSTYFYPISIKYEKAIGKYFGWQTNINYANFKLPFFRNTVVGANKLQFYNYFEFHAASIISRINFHYSFSNKFDFFIGTGIGYRMALHHYSIINPNTYTRHNYWEIERLNLFKSNFLNLMPFGFEFASGFLYNFRPKIALRVEAGIAKSFLQLGINYRID